MSRQGIPTEYAGIRFRSRLEAQWAAFFDLLQWRWEYEPFDLRGYIPDFSINAARFGKPSTLLVDVKPAASCGELTARSQEWVTKTAGWSGDVLFVGASLLLSCDAPVPHQRLAVGHHLYSYAFDGCDAEDVRMASNITTPACATISKCRPCGRFFLDTLSCWCGAEPYASGEVGEPHVDELGIKHNAADADDGLLRSAWAAAKNRVQWKGEYGA